MPTKIRNTYDQLLAARDAGLPDVAVQLATSTGPRGESIAEGWRLWSPGNIASGALNARNSRVVLYGSTYYYWMLPGSLRSVRRQARLLALEEGRLRYGVKRWKRNRMMDYVDERVAKAFPLRAID